MSDMEKGDNFFDNINSIIRGGEASFVNLLSAIGPWAAPISPAYMTYKHSIEILDFPVWVGLTVAAVVEILGLSTINTALNFWTHNKRERAEKNKAPVWIAIFAFGFYLLVILSSNVVLDASLLIVSVSDVDEWSKILVKGLFTLLSIPAALIIAVRTQYQDLLSEIKNEKRERKQEKRKRDLGSQTLQKLDESLTKPGQNFKSYRTAMKKFTDDDTYFLLTKTPSEIQERFSLASIQTGVNWKKCAERDFELKPKT